MSQSLGEPGAHPVLHRLKYHRSQLCATPVWERRLQLRNNKGISGPEVLPCVARRKNIGPKAGHPLDLAGNDTIRLAVTTPFMDVGGPPRLGLVKRLAQESKGHEGTHPLFQRFA